MTTDIKPDTSLYPHNSPEFYMALAEIVKRGGEIQSRPIDQRNRGEGWDLTDEISGVTKFDHRLKPEPRVVWVNLYADGLRRAFHYESEREARMAASPCDLIATAVRVELPE